LHHALLAAQSEIFITGWYEEQETCAFFISSWKIVVIEFWACGHFPVQLKYMLFLPPLQSVILLHVEFACRMMYRRYITPEIYLMRGHKDHCLRLEEILLQAAQRGVKIYILTWNETKVGVFQISDDGRLS
jgi:hypothetical protein